MTTLLSSVVDTGGRARNLVTHKDASLSLPSVVATGGRARKLFAPGSDLERIYLLRTPEDAKNIASSVKKETKVVVIGSSFIGMEVGGGIALKCFW